jgi:hypothetical protein
MNILAANKLLTDLALLPDAERKQADALLKRLSALMDKARKAGQLSYDTDSIVGGAPVSLPVDAAITLTAKQGDTTKLAPIVAKELGIKLPEQNDLAFIEKIGPDFVKWLQQDKQHAALLVAEPALAFQAFAKDKGVTPPDSLLKHLTAITEQACKMTGTGVRLNSVTVATSF